MNPAESPTGLFDNTGRPLDRMPDLVKVATNGVIFDSQGGVLLQRRADNGFWGLPGGMLDPGESLEQGAVREVWEETSLQVTVKRLVGIYSDPKLYNIATYPGDNIVQIVTVVFECAYQSGELAISDESTDIGYFTPGRLPENTVLSHYQRIEDTLSNNGQPYVR